MTLRKILNPNLPSLRRLLGISAVLYAGLAVLAYGWMSRVTSQVTVSHLAKDELASSNSTVLAPAGHLLYDVQIRCIVIVVLLISLVLPLLYLSRWQKRYKKSLDNKVVLARWVDFGITGGLILETLAILSGIQDFMTIKVVISLVVIAAALNWISEKRNLQAGRLVWSEFIVSLFAILMAWLVIGSAAIHSVIYGLVRSPGYVYALYAVVLAGFILLAINQYNHIRQFRSWTDYRVVERNYLLIGGFIKIAFAVILLAGLFK